MLFDGNKTLWQLAFTLPQACEKETVLAEAENVFRVSAGADGIRAELETYYAEATPRFGAPRAFRFTLTSPRTSGRLMLVWRQYSVRLYVGDELEDEDWPLGGLTRDTWETVLAPCVRDAAYTEPALFAEDPEQAYDRPFQHFVLPGHNTGVGDCMPFERDGKYCLFYLLDRRGHASKQGLGAHQWAQVSSSDLRHWVIHPMAIGITEQWEGSICTGSVIEKDGTYYAFYAARMSDGTPARLTWAESTDGVRFVKSGRYFSLTAPYEPVSARDPKVFRGADGQYHMLVTTSLVKPEEDGGVSERFSGCLAHLVSPDLLSWRQLPPFLVPGYTVQPECADYFEWNGWYYLFFSTLGVAHYRLSRSPFGPWERPAFDQPDAQEIRVPKTAAFRGRRLSTGFLDRRPRSYAGNAVTHELFQRQDGTLGIRFAEELLPVCVKKTEMPDRTLSAGEGRQIERLLETKRNFRVQAQLEIPDERTQAGFLLSTAAPDGKRRLYQLLFDPAAKTVTAVRPGEEMALGHGRETLTQVADMRAIGLDLLLTGDIMELMLSDGRGMTLRLEERVCGGTELSFFALCGNAALKNIRVSGLADE